MVDTDITPNILVSLKGDPKAGKTHFAFTFPAPIACISLDFGAKYILRKFPEKKIELFRYEMPVIDTARPKPYANDLWTAARDDIYYAIDSAEYKTVVIDTGTVLWELCRIAYKEREAKNGMLPRDYGEANANMAGIFDKAQLGGVNLVVISHLKDEYLNDKSTGNRILDGWKRTDALSDVCLDIEMVKNKSRITIGGNRFDKDITGQTIDDATYDDLIALLGV